jgi:hypothetical protein
MPWDDYEGCFEAKMLSRQFEELQERFDALEKRYDALNERINQILLQPMGDE